MNNPSKLQLVLGWTAVSVSILATCFWSFWGIIENFHEGWHYRTWHQNIGLMFLQYLSPMLTLLIATLIRVECGTGLFER
jgi:hypothetical protein